MVAVCNKTWIARAAFQSTPSLCRASLITTIIIITVPIKREAVASACKLLQTEIQTTSLSDCQCGRQALLAGDLNNCAFTPSDRYILALPYLNGYK